MKLFPKLPRLRLGSRSLKQTLAFYFIPISVIPVVVLSVYATRVFQSNTWQILLERASSERDAIIAEIEAREANLLEQARRHAERASFLRAVQSRNKSRIQSSLKAFRVKGRLRVFSRRGQFLAGWGKKTVQQIDYMSRTGLKQVLRRGQTFNRYFNPDGKGFVTIFRHLLRTKRGRILGIYEEEHHFGRAELMALKRRRQVDVVLFDRNFSHISASFALPDSLLENVSRFSFQSIKNPNAPQIIELGDQRYATFLYDLPGVSGKKKAPAWGYLTLFFSMNAIDAAVGELKWAMVYLTVILVFLALLLIFLFSNLLVKPLEGLVSAMKRVQAGRVEQIPEVESAYEVEYLVRSFNDMARNITEAKKTLEMRLQELHRANNEIKQTQTTLIQQAKMASLGQIVAGVAHELNNPIGFIYSNMHHLSEYMVRIRNVLLEYQKLHKTLSPKQKEEIEKLLKDKEIEFILQDVEDLAQSCLDGAQRTKDIVLGLRTFSRMDESSFVMTDIHEGLKSTIKLLGTEFKDRIKIHQDFGEIPFVECHPSQLNQVFMNLLSNAAQAIEGPGEIWIHTRAEETKVVIEIEDSGSGIPQESLEKIFDPFFTTKKVGEGTGLGLSIAYGLIQKHNGTIEVHSEIGVGTRFTITLPVTQPVSLTQRSTS